MVGDLFFSPFSSLCIRGLRFVLLLLYLGAWKRKFLFLASSLHEAPTQTLRQVPPPDTPTCDVLPPPPAAVVVVVIVV